ncbi:hypothetical protein AAU61_07670 [Desulfocarbo indianensis]|nr:hypothetical protein AAU61_07670 [Desulfocarbo indianensis]
MTSADNPKNRTDIKARPAHWPTKFEIYGQEMIEKSVAKSGKCGRIYVPLDWLGKNIKIIRVD